MENRFKTRFMIRAALLISAAVLLASCGAGSTAETGAINLSGTWKFIDSDPPEASDPLFNDSSYRDITMPGIWFQHLSSQKDLSGTIWVRKKILIDETFRNKSLSFLTGRTGIANEVWFNGHCIGKNGIIPETDKSLTYIFSWQHPRIYRIPGSIIRYNKDNVIAVRVFSHVISGIKGPIEISEVSTDFFSAFFKTSGSLLANILAIAFNGLFFIGLLLLYFSRREKKEYIYFAAITFLTLLCTLFTLDLPFFHDGPGRFKIIMFLYILTNYFVLLGVTAFLEYRNKWFFITASALLLITEIFILSAADTRFLIYRAGPLSMFAVNIFILAAAALFFRSAWLDPRRYWYFLFIAVPIPLSVLRNSWYLMNLDFNSLPVTIFMHVPLVFALFSMYYIYEFESTRKENKTLYAALLRKANRTQRILQSMKKNDAKPDPRDVIYEVIEYLDINYKEAYSRKELAKKFGLNEDYMGQIFKKTAGLNISNYINARRIEAVKELLTETDSKIIDIAYHVGFENLTHFHRQFKTITNLTPSQYREQKSKES